MIARSTAILFFYHMGRTVLRTITWFILSASIIYTRKLRAKTRKVDRLGIGFSVPFGFGYMYIQDLHQSQHFFSLMFIWRHHVCLKNGPIRRNIANPGADRHQMTQATNIKMKRSPFFQCKSNHQLMAPKAECNTASTIFQDHFSGYECTNSLPCFKYVSSCALRES